MEETRLKEYSVSLATEADTVAILELLNEVANWLRETGSKQWTTVSSGEEDDEIRQAIADEMTFVIKKNQIVVATFTIYKEQSDWDEWLWGKTDEIAAYLHKLALKPTEIGKGFGKNVLQWIENHVENEGINKLRLDCIGNNEKLNDFYSGSGYRKLAERKRFSLFEKVLL